MDFQPTERQTHWRDRVRDFIVGAYVRGRSCVTAQDAEFEDSTAVFTKRRYRDKWNRSVVKRVGESPAHCIKIKARVRAKGQRSMIDQVAAVGILQNWLDQRRAALSAHREAGDG